MDLRAKIEQAKMHQVNGKSEQAYNLIFEEFKNNHQSVEKSHPILQQTYYMLSILAIGRKFSLQRSRKWTKRRNS